MIQLLLAMPIHPVYFALEEYHYSGVLAHLPPFGTTRNIIHHIIQSGKRFVVQIFTFIDHKREITSESLLKSGL
jgi:hypothetical protein